MIPLIPYDSHTYQMPRLNGERDNVEPTAMVMSYHREELLVIVGQVSRIWQGNLSQHMVFEEDFME